MKKLLSLLLISLMVMSFTSCQINQKNGKTNETQSTTDNQNPQGNDTTKEKTTVDYSKVLKDLNKKETKFVDSLGVTEKGKKIVAFFGDDFETQFIVAEFKDGKAYMIKNYRFFKEDSKYEAYKLLSEKSDVGFVAHEKEMCIEQNETKKYRGKTYEEMQEILTGYDYKY